jgi:hypothetical protein
MRASPQGRGFVDAARGDDAGVLGNAASPPARGGVDDVSVVGEDWRASPQRRGEERARLLEKVPASQNENNLRIQTMS